MVLRNQALRLMLTALVLITSGCGEFVAPPRAESMTIHTVRPGDTLYSIAWRYGYDYREVAAWNNIPSPYRIFVGQQISLVRPHNPNEPLRTTPAERQAAGRQQVPPVTRQTPSSTPVRPTTTANGGTSPPPTTSVPRTPSASAGGGGGGRQTPPASSGNNGGGQTASGGRASGGNSGGSASNGGGTAAIRWQWPTTGQVVTRFDPGNGKKGIDIQGQAGQPVHAVAAGEVVYSGAGLLGYGKLVIIKHDDTYLSAYGHNSRLLVGEGVRVSAGQKIAEMGQNPKTGSILHLEIRREGKPVDPLKYLPRR